MLDWRHGIALLFVTAFLLPMIKDAIEVWDQAEKEHDENCNPLLTGGVIDAQLCSELENDSSAKFRTFSILSLAALLSAISGLALILPSGGGRFPHPPPGLR